MKHGVRLDRVTVVGELEDAGAALLVEPCVARDEERDARAVREEEVARRQPLGDARVVERERGHRHGLGGPRAGRCEVGIGHAGEAAGGDAGELLRAPVDAYAYPDGARTAEVDAALLDEVRVLRSVTFTVAGAADPCPR